MDAISNLGVLLGGSWASGVNLYLTTAALGVAGKMGWVDLPGNLDMIQNPLIIALAVILYAIEFFADKIPLVDSAWDSVHTFIRPAGAAAMAFAAGSDMGPVMQVPLAMMSGSVALESHMTKATARAAINTSPEPITNSVASVTEDATVVGIVWLIVQHPALAAVAGVLLIILSFFILKMLFKFVKKIFGFLFGKKGASVEGPQQDPDTPPTGKE